MNNIDLIVSSVTAPLDVTLGETIPVSWTVKNQGTVSASSYWYDYIYISNDQFFDNSDTFLLYRYGGQNTPLASGGSYTATENISIPNSLAPGNISHYLLFVTDGGYGYQAETNETNNIFAQAITINAPDLVVTAANVPITVALGETISVSWTVKNQGTVSASSYWYDYIYISNDQFLDDSDTFVLYSSSGGPLASDSSYTRNSDIFIPDDVGSGVHYLLFVADGGGYYNNQLETNEDNNVFAQAFTINDPPDVDLVITAANAPTTAGLGDTISVSWTVKNQGTVSTSSDWYDYIYISDDQFFDESDFRLTDGYTRENKLLASGSSYTITQDIYIDNSIAPGDRYLLFVADRDHYQGETNETNNVFAQAIAINNAPDLVVTAANAPTTIASGETISVSWTVKNQSTISAKAYYWYDYVYISDDQFFDNSDTQLASHERRENTPLVSDSSYTVTKDIYIYNFVLGDYVAAGDVYLLFVADRYNYQGETNETNNVFAQAITIAAPDFVVTAANAPTTAALGETISVSWTVKNQGTISGFFTTDYIYISDDQFFDSSDTLVGEYSGWPLASGSSNTATQNISIPNTVAPGDRYLLFVADGRNNQVETNETNNVFAQAITINDAPDLVITAANAPTTAALGETISVSWTVKNQGLVSTSSNWYDYIYISNDQFFDNNDTYLSRRDAAENTPLASGGSYTATQDISIFNFFQKIATGDRYLLFVADGGGYLDENQIETNETNNVFAQAITIAAPDLVITAANAPTTAVLGETISVSWTVKNQGTVSTSSNWYDYIYISNDQFFDYSDTQLTSRYTGENTPLAAAGSYIATQDIYISNSVATGDRYLLFVADGGYSNQSETNEDNNVFAQAITINAPDLVITAANAPTTAALGETISVSWTVKNHGTVSAFADWYDRVYISDDQFFDYSDHYLTSYNTGENTPLASGDSYTATEDIYISNSVAGGDRYLLFIADGGDFNNNQVETDETNNVFAQAITINAPDLVITAANAPTTAVLGETISVSWTVKNQGLVSTSSNWYDYIYISDDQFFDNSDTQLSSRNAGEDTPLASGGSYTATQDISIFNFFQKIATGDRYLLFVADGGGWPGDNQGETNETNNVFAQVITLTAPDLVITAVNAPTRAALGETISVSWTVKNQGMVSAFADWYDAVYISNDQFFDESDRQLTSRYAGEYTPLVAAGSYTATQDISIPDYGGIGDRYLLFVADGARGWGSNSQVETNEDNNVFAQAINISNDVPDLVITAANAPTTAALGETISVSWTVKNQGTVSASSNWYDYIYISDDQFFDNSDTYLSLRDAAKDTPLAAAGSYIATQDIFISNSVATGDRYLLFIADGGNFNNNQVETNETNNVFAQAITINAPDLVITAANAPTTAALGETISVSWTVKNQGLVSTSSNWYDYVYISNDQFFDSSDTQLTGYDTRENTPLASGGSYTATQDIYIGGYGYVATGDRYLLFVTDAERGWSGDNQAETNEDNNVFAQAITINAPDLIVTAANAPTTAALNETISVSWTVKNQGTVSASSNWYDYVYISDDQFFDYSDTYLTSRYAGEDTPLASGGSYTATQDISIFNSVATGDRYLLFVTDAGGGWSGDNQGETNETNNVFAQAITIAAPDLVVTAANAPTTAALNETISVSWTVKNQGTVSAFGNWYDYVYISDDQFFDYSDTYLTSRYAGEDTPLAAADSYTATQDISIFNSVATGDRYLLFVTDAERGWSGDNQGETNEDNNVFAQAITINAPDLVITAANAPTTAALRETISVSWTVKNQGTVSAFGDWYDAIYISDDQFFDYWDVELTERYTGENTPLASGDSYTITQDIDISYLGTGDRYLLFVTDAERGWSGNNQGEANETNNVFAQAITIAAPDLLITAANAPTTAALRETISVSWTVKNQGTVSAFGDWYDSIYISDDQFFDYWDVELTERYTGENTPLAPGDSYTITQDIDISYLGTGDRYLLFVTDAERGWSGDNQGETNEDNNVFAQAITIAAPDLLITAANAPTTAALRETISVSWTVKNQGTVSAFGDWYDAIYISDDQFFDYWDVELTERYTGENTPLASGDSYTITQDIDISYLGTGERYLLFVADAERGWSGNNQAETDETNNVFAQAITLTAPDLVVTAASAPTTAALGQTISVSWTVKNQGTVSAFGDWYDSIYISDDQFRDSGDRNLIIRYTGENTPLASGGSYTATQDIYIPDYIATGDVYDGLRQRYLLFVADEYGYQVETNENNNIQAVAISLYAQDQIFNGTPGRDTLTGNDSNNLITGLQGADTLTGGAGSDRFVYTSIRDAGDKITDFVAGTDKIDLSQLFQSLSLGSLDYESATTQGYLSFGTVLSNTTVNIDLDGTTGRARPTPLLTVQNVSQSTIAQSDNFVF
ncbi:type I secretion C-terminal target domain-containing protein [Desmonostoc muscorum CCALA 125]|nr:type I secretion C-terminal target domain-containing protein [Desmonostoc muscorum CCALA 125]